MPSYTTDMSANKTYPNHITKAAVRLRQNSHSELTKWEKATWIKIDRSALLVKFLG